MVATRAGAAHTNTSRSVISQAGSNLLVNAGAEVGDPSANGWDAVTIPGWRVLRGLPTVVGYGTPRYPSPTTHGPKRRGDNLFVGGAGGTSALAQLVPVRYPSGRPRPRRVSFTASAWLGASGRVSDEASLRVWFLGRHGADLGHAVVGPVTQADRHGSTELLRRSTTGILPGGTAAIRVELILATEANDFDGPYAPRRGFDRAEADDVSLDLSAPVRRPPPVRPPRPKVPHFDHVFLFYMENQDYRSIIGNTKRAPFINSLLPKASLLSNLYAEAHPSDANYLAFAAGSALGLPLTDPLEENPTFTLDAKNIGDTVVAAHETWKGYLQSANGPCDDTVHDQYWDDDLPFLYFKDIRGRPDYCAAHVTPLTQMTTDLKHTSSTPNFSWIGADDCFDMEGCGVKAGDTFLKSTMSQIFRSPAWTTQRSLIILTWDEDLYAKERPAQRVPTIVLGSEGVKRGYVSHHRYTHYSLLRTTEAALGLRTLTKNDLYASPLNDVFGPVGRTRIAISGDDPVLPAMLAPPQIAARKVARGQSDFPTSDGPVAYVVNSLSGTVIPIDIATNKVGTPIHVGLHPQAIAITPNGHTAYVADWSSGSVTPIDTATNRARAPIHVGSHPRAIAITPNGHTAYVADWGSGTVTPINIATNTAGPPIHVGSYPQAITITPNGHTAYVANWGSSSVSAIDTATNTAGTPIHTGSYPFAIAVTPNGQTAYVADWGSNDVTPIDTASNTAGPRIPTGRAPDAIAFGPMGRTAYVVDSDSNEVTPIDTASNTAGAPIVVGYSPSGIAVGPAGKTAYVVNTISGTVTPINTATNRPGWPISVGRYKYPIDIVMTPGGFAEVVDTYSGEVSRIDTRTNRTAKPPLAVGSFPVAIAIRP
jgi:YVTN family beta-propeller protein